MRRIACLDLPALPLQLVWRESPALRDEPVVVIESERPQGLVLWACERARASGVLAGQRYAHALSLCGGLKARVVPGEQIEAAIVELRTALHAMSPNVEVGEPGTFWLDGDGLERIFLDGRAPAGTAWGMAIARVVAASKLTGAIVVGFSRFATFAIARATRTGLTVLRADADERAAATAVPLARLDLAPRLRDELARLGVTTVGQMVRLPGGGVLERFGREAHQLYQLAAGERWDPLVPLAPPEAPDETVLLDDEDDDVERLMFVIKAPIDRLLERLGTRGRALTALHLELALKLAVGKIELRADCIKPAEATLDGRILMRLVHLRLSGMPPAAPVNAIRVWADDAPATREQLALFASRPRRDLRAADEALAKIRAELGDDAVVRAAPRDGHLPEASFAWERLVHVVPARPRDVLVRPLIRRMLARAQPLPPQAHQVRDDGWLLSGLEHGAVVRIVGPYIVSGGWWTQAGAAAGVHREYHYAELKRGDCLWVYYDRNRRRWFWQGAVE
ncbi:MAG: DNA polymerase Y family protein [Deltaproteobacteria bacterium]|nr:DNA polymerase Y family protein [Deltaproteobacteria bacterium]